jgi:hypothetical protein
VKRETEKKHMVHWQACPNYKTLYGDGGELNLVSYHLKYCPSVDPKLFNYLIEKDQT